MKWLFTTLFAVLLTAQLALAQLIGPYGEINLGFPQQCPPGGCPQGADCAAGNGWRSSPQQGLQGPTTWNPPTSWQGSIPARQAVPPMVRQYQGLQQVAPRGPSMGYITIGDPATVNIPNAPPVPNPDPRLGLSVRDDVRRQQREIADLKRTKADGGQILPVQMGTPPGVLTDQQAAGIMGNLDGMSQTVLNLDDRVVRLENALETGLKIIDDMKPQTEAGQALYDKARASIDEARAEAAKATAALEKATGDVPKIAEAAVNETLEDPSFWERFKNRAKQGFIPGYQLPAVAEKLGVTWVWKALAGLGLGTTTIAIFVAIIIFIVRRRVPMARNLMEKGADRLTGVIPGQVDDLILKFGRRILDGVDERLNDFEERVGIPTPAPRKRSTKKAK